MAEDIVERTYKESRKLLSNLITESGFMASTEPIANYRRIWARDGVIAGLAALQTEDPKLIETFKQTLFTLKRNQDHTGRIPSNVSLDGKHVSYGMSVGRIDATLWFAIGVSEYILRTRDDSFLEEFKAPLERALFYLSCLELNGRGLIYIPLGGDWADEYINNGYVLFDQMLYLFALEGASAVLKEPKIDSKKEKLAELIRVNYFPAEENAENEHVYNQVLFLQSLKEYAAPLPVAYFTNHSVRYHLDTFAVSLLLFSDIISDEQKETIEKEVWKRCGNDSFPILPAFHPVITPEHEHWIRLKWNYSFSFKNKPYEYHNGGLWPLVHGFFLAGMSETQRAESELEKFAQTLAREHFIFPEYYHGETHAPKGTTNLGFSASSYIIAYHSVVDNKKIFEYDSRH